MRAFGRLEEALKMLLAMKEAGLKPDEARTETVNRLDWLWMLWCGEVVFNNLLGGCINDCKLELAKDFLHNLQNELGLFTQKLIVSFLK